TLETRLAGRRGGSALWVPAALLGAVLPLLAGCSREPSEEDRQNRREFDALLTAITLKSPNLLEDDARRIEGRVQDGLISDALAQELREIIRKAMSGDWAGAEAQAYEFRNRHPFIK